MSRIIILLLTFCTGLAGLTYEVTWHRYLSNLLGSQAQASALILAVFLGGLSVGYHIFGRISKNKNGVALIYLCGATEICIGLWSLLFPLIYSTVWNKVGLHSPGGVGGFFLDCGVAIVLIGLPTILMGGTLPLLTQALSLSRAEAPKLHAAIYAANTAGAFFGALTAGFVLIPSFGLPLTLTIAATINIFAGIIIIALKNTAADQSLKNEEAQTAKIRSENSLSIWRASAVAFLNGLCSIALQTICIRLVGLSVGSSEYAFCVVVSVFILMLAVGASGLTKDGGTAPLLSKNLLFLVLGALLLYLMIPYAPYAAHVIRTMCSNTGGAFYLYQVLIFALITAALLIPVGAMGRTMPLLFGAVDSPISKLGSTVGVLYGINTIGCVIGALAGGYLSLFVIDLDQLFKCCLFLMLLSLFLVIRKHVGAIAAAILLIAILPRWNKEYIASGLFREQVATPATYQGPTAVYDLQLKGGTTIAYKDDPNTTVSVREYPIDDPKEREKLKTSISRALVVNGKSDGITNGIDLLTTKLLGHLPGLFYDGAPAH
jgi:spermidine synthase